MICLSQHDLFFAATPLVPFRCTTSLLRINGWPILLLLSLIVFVHTWGALWQDKEVTSVLPTYTFGAFFSCWCLFTSYLLSLWSYFLVHRSVRSLDNTVEGVGCVCALIVTATHDLDRILLLLLLVANDNFLLTLYSIEQPVGLQIGASC